MTAPFLQYSKFTVTILTMAQRCIYKMDEYNLIIKNMFLFFMEYICRNFFDPILLDLTAKTLEGTKLNQEISQSV